jgi:hypothetical protein
VEPTRERLQEFTVRWSAADGGQPKALELVINPDLTHNAGLATLAAWRVS